MDASGAWALARRMGLFLVPVLVLLGIGEVALQRTGEGWPVRRALDAQFAEPGEALYGRGLLSQQFNVYKLAALQRRQPSIVVLGSSRVMQFRDFMFAPRETEAYNAGGLIQGVWDLGAFADRVESGDLPDADLYLVGVDPWWIKQGGSPPSWLGEKDASYRPAAHFSAVGTLLRQRRLLDLLAAERRSPHYGIPALGTLATQTGSGFRKDGSRQYPPSMVLDFVGDPVYRDRERPPIVSRIENHTNQFALPATVDPRAVDALVSSLARLARAAEVVVILPPVTDEVLAALERDSLLEDLLNAYREAVPAMLAEGDIQVVPMMTPDELGMDNRSMIDGFHAGEVLTAALLSEMIRTARPTSALRTLDRQALAARVDRAALPLAFEIPPERRTRPR